MKTYKYRKRTTYEGVKIDVRADTKIELGQKLQKRIEQIKQGAVIKSSNISVKDWMGHYIKTYKKKQVAPSTYQGYIYMINKWINPQIGNLPIKDLTPTHCQSLINSMYANNKRHITKTKQLLSSAFDVAVDSEILLKNPAKRIVLPKSKDGTRRAITNEERKALLYACSVNQYGLGALCMLYLGLRPGETARLKFSHIDLENQTIYIDGIKTKASKRLLLIHPALLPKFEGLDTKNDNLIFTYHSRSLDNHAMHRMWKSIKKDMHKYLGGELDYKTLRRVVEPHRVANDLVPYCLRHTYCTDLQAAGVPINIAKELMGHSSITLTANIYTHSSTTSFETARNQINAFENIKNTI